MEDFVTYEQAQRLKELVFDGDCYHWYFNPTRNKVHICIHDCFDYEDMTRAPSLAQAAKWIRNKGLFIHIYLHLDDCWRFELLDINCTGRYVYDPEFGLWWRTFEEALSAGIDQALQILTDKIRFR